MILNKLIENALGRKLSSTESTILSIGEAILAYKGYKSVKNYYDEKKAKADAQRARDLMAMSTDPAFSLPTAEMTIPGQGTVTVVNPNVAELGNSFAQAYNAQGVLTDLGDLVKTLYRTPPKYFKAVAQFYSDVHHRDLYQDLESALGGYPTKQQVWDPYKSQLIGLYP